MARIHYEPKPKGNASLRLSGSALIRVALCAMLPLLGATPADATSSASMPQIQPPLGQAMAEQAKVDAVLQWHQIAQRAANGRWQLARANLKPCSKLRSSFGMSLHDSGFFPSDYRETAMQAFELQTGRPSIWTVAPGGPADWAGLRVGDVIVAVNGSQTASEGPVSPSDMDPVQRTGSLLDAVPEGQIASLTVARAGILMGFSLAPQSICAGTFETSAAHEIAMLAKDKPILAGLEAGTDEELAKSFIRLTSPPPVVPAAPTSAAVKASKSGTAKISKTEKGGASIPHGAPVT